MAAPPASDPNKEATGVAVPKAGEAAAESKKPKDTPFKQQRLPSWQPVMSPPYVIACFGIIAIIFIPIGAAIIAASDGIIQIDKRYDHIQACPWQDRTAASMGYACAPLTIPFQVERTMPAPVFIYYELENYYQNHRRYAKSRNELQLAGYHVDLDQLGGDCDPFRYPGQYISLAGENTSVPYDATSGPINVEGVAYNPCGLIAWSMFNDTIDIVMNSTTAAQNYLCKGDNFRPNGDPIDPTLAPNCVKKGIEWPSDPGGKYKAPQRADSTVLTSSGWPNAPNGTAWPLAPFMQNGWYVGEEGHKIPDTTDLDLMVWMRLASLSKFRKLYRKITVDVQPGTYDMVVHQRYDIRQFQGKKNVILTTSAWTGGKNYFLGGLYVAVGSLCLILALAFGAKYATTPRRVGRL